MTDDLGRLDLGPTLAVMSSDQVSADRGVLVNIGNARPETGWRVSITVLESEELSKAIREWLDGEAVEGAAP